MDEDYFRHLGHDFEVIQPKIIKIGMVALRSPLLALRPAQTSDDLTKHAAFRKGRAVLSSVLA